MTGNDDMKPSLHSPPPSSHTPERAQLGGDVASVDEGTKGAEGIMQLIPSTAKRFGVSNIFDPKENILGGVKYLKFLLDYYQNDYVRAIAAYNAGEAAVDKYNGVPPFSETRNYVHRVSPSRAVRCRRRRSGVSTARTCSASTATCS